MDYKKLGFTAFLTIVASMLAGVVIYKLPVIFGWIKELIKILMPFIIGGIIAYMLYPLYKIFNRFFSKYFKRTHLISIVLCTLLFIGVIAVLIVMIVPGFIESVSQLINSDYTTQIYNAIVNNDFVRKYFSAETIYDFFYNTVLPYFTTFMGNVLNWAVDFAASLVTSIKNFVIGIIVAIYIMLDYEALIEKTTTILPKLIGDNNYDRVARWSAFISKTFSNFIRGKLMDSLIIGMLCFIVITIAQVPYALLISVIIGVTNIIPVFGPFIGAVPSALLIMINSPKHVLFFIIFIIILQQLDGNVIGPKILGDQVGVDSFWILFSIMLFGSLFGIVGMIVGVPIFAVFEVVVKEVFDRIIKRRNEKNKVKG